jgi:iron complex outermembrane recepter protein
MKKIQTLLLMLFVSMSIFAQTTIKGKVMDAENNEALPGATVKVKKTGAVAVTDLDGNFTITIREALPQLLLVSYTGYRTAEVEAENNLEVKLTTQVLSAQEVVVSASRVEEEMVKAAVTVEKLTSRQLALSPASNPYDALGGLKGVDLLTQSLSFKSVNLRGFGANNNNRFVQLTDGMDNRSPGLGFGFGGVAGISDLDIQSIEILPGASSALYGPDALQGLMLTKSKNPFQTQGLSAQVKVGVNNVGSSDFDAPTPYTDIAIRYAKAFTSKLALKVNIQRLDGTDFVANDYNDRSTRARGGFWTTDPARGNVATGIAYTPNSDKNANFQYDGVNIYGDDINNGSAFTYPASYPANPALQGKVVTRTGYTELDLVGNKGKIFNNRANASLHYKINNKIEASLGWYYGGGNFIRTAGFREYFPDYKRNQFKAEIAADNFFVRAYRTQQEAEGYNLGLIAQRINNSWKPMGTWATDFGKAYNGSNIEAARAAADAGRYLPGSADFTRVRDLFANTLTTDTIAAPGFKGLKGTRFRDNSALTHVEGMYNFKNQISFIELLVGGSYRKYNLASSGTLFPLKTVGTALEEYTIAEYGAYAQASKEISLGDKASFKPTAAVRYDKNQYFKGGFTPRLSGVLNLGEHNVRVSWQSAFRNPSPSQLFAIPPAKAGGEVGGSKIAAEGANLYNNPVYLEADVNDYIANKITADQLKEKAYNPDNFTTEKIKTWEVGYKTLIGDRLYVDAFYYQSQYTDFIAAQNMNQSILDAPKIEDLKTSNTRRTLQVNFNNFNQIFVNGYGLGLEYAIGQGYTVNANYANQVGTVTLKDAQGNVRKDKAGEEIVKRKMSNPEVSELGRNFFISPENRFNIGFGNSKVTKNIGFNVNYRWTDKMWVEQGTTAGDVWLPSWTSLDAQVSYRLPKAKTVIKLGATNLLNKYYSQGYGLAQIGGMYYISFTYDPLSF